MKNGSVFNDSNTWAYVFILFSVWIPFVSAEIKLVFLISFIVRSSKDDSTLNFAREIRFVFLISLKFLSKKSFHSVILGSGLLLDFPKPRSSPRSLYCIIADLNFEYNEGYFS